MRVNWKSLLRIAVSVVLVAWLLSTLDFGEFWTTLRTASLPMLAGGLLLNLPGVAISAYKWQTLLRCQGILLPRFLGLWRLYHVGIFFSNFLPTEMGGDVVRSYAVGKPAGKVQEALSAVVVERASGLLAVVLYGVVGVLLNWHLAAHLGLTYVGFGCLLAMIAGVYVVQHEELAAWLQSKLSWGPLRRLLLKAKSFYWGLVVYKSHRRVLVEAIVNSFVNQAFSVLIIYVLAQAFGITGLLRELMLIVPMLMLIGVLPIGINGLGVREGAFVFLFAQVGTPEPEALALAIASRIGLLLPGLLGGLLYAFGSRSERDVEPA